MHLLLCRVREDFLHLLEGHRREELGDLRGLEAGFPIADNAVVDSHTGSAHHVATPLHVRLRFNQRAI